MVVVVVIELVAVGLCAVDTPQLQPTHARFMGRMQPCSSRRERL